MSALKDVLDGIREVLRLSDQIKATADVLKGLAAEVRDHDRRLVRLETMAEIAQAGLRAKRRALPDES